MAENECEDSNGEISMYIHIKKRGKYQSKEVGMMMTEAARKYGNGG